MIGALKIRFDLRELQARAWRVSQNRQKHYVMIGGLVLINLLFFAIYYVRFSTQGLNPSTEFTLLPLPFLEVPFVLAPLALAQGAHELVLSDNAIILLYPSSKQRVYDLTLVRTRLKVRGHDDPGYGELQWYISGGLPYRSFIPPEAKVAILDLVQRQGFPLRQKVWQGETVFTFGPKS